MPLYDYRCNTCGTAHEALVKLDHREQPQTCPKCGDHAYRVLLTPPRFSIDMLYTSNSPEFADKYERLCKQRREKEEKSLRDHGDYGPAPGAD